MSRDVQSCHGLHSDWRLGRITSASLNLPGSVILSGSEVKTMSSDKDPVNAARGSLRLAPNAVEVEIEKAKLPRQFVNFTFYHARPEWRLLSAGDKQRCRDEFVKTVDEFRSSLLIHSYRLLDFVQT